MIDPSFFLSYAVLCIKTTLCGKHLQCASDYRRRLKRPIYPKKISFSVTSCRSSVFIWARMSLMSFFGVGVNLRLLDRSLICPSVNSSADRFAIFKLQKESSLVIFLNSKSCLILITGRVTALSQKGLRL